MKWLSTRVIFTLLYFFLFAPAAFAEIYSYVDSKGILHFTNVPTDTRYKPMEYDGPKQGVNLKDQRRQYDAIILNTSRKYALEPALIRAIVKVESDFDPIAVSRAGALGLMQLMPQTAKEMKVKNPFDPRENVEGGVKYFKKMWETFDGDIILSLAAYNAGAKAVSKYNQVPPYRQTRDYVEKVLTYYYIYKNK